MKRAIWLGTASALTLLSTQELAHAAGNIQVAADNSKISAVEEVVVTARRREELAQHTPVAISTFTAEQLRSPSVQDITDLTKFVPGVNFTFQNSSINTSLSIRGQSRTASGDAPSAVMSYINEVPTLPMLSALPTYDVANVQVLKGPQGTLFGRNSTAGAILLTTQKPKYEFGASVSATYGDYDWQDYIAVVNVPIVANKVALRVAGDYLRRDGYVKIVNRPGDRLDGQNLDSFRVSLLLDPAPWLSNVTVFDYNHFGLLDSGPQLYKEIPGGFAPAFYACSTGPDCNLLDGVARQQAAGPSKAWTSNPTNGTATTESWINTTTIDLGWGTLKNIFGYRNISISNIGDIIGWTGPLLNGAGLTNMEQFSDELQISGTSFRDALTWVAGVFYLKDEPSGANQTVLQEFANVGTPFTSPLIGPFVGGGSGPAVFFHDKSQAVYGQVNYKLEQLWSKLEGVSVDVGLRYTSDRQNVCDVPGIRYIDPPPKESDCAAGTHARFASNKLTYTFGLNWQATDHILAYAVTRSGYRSGGINAPVLGGTLTPYQTYRPQTVRDIELGLKSNWRVYDIPNQLNLALYNADYTDIQGNMTLVNPSASGVDGDSDPTDDPVNNSLTINAGKARVRGIEADYVVKPLPNLTLTAGAAWMDKQVTEVSLTLPSTTEVTVTKDLLASKVFLSSPDHSYSASASYVFTLPDNAGSLTASASFFSIPKVNFEALTAPAWTRVDLSLDWGKIFGTNVDANVFVNNVADEHPVVSGGTTNPLIGVTSVYYGPPRMVGFRLRYAFGSEAR